MERKQWVEPAKEGAAEEPRPLTMGDCLFYLLIAAVMLIALFGLDGGMSR